MSNSRQSQKRPRLRTLALEVLEPRAVPAAMPLHVVVSLDSFEGGRVEAAALQPNGTLRLVGARTIDTIRPWSWTVSREGALLAQEGFETLPDHSTGAIGLISPDGSEMVGWLAGIPNTELLVWPSHDSEPTVFEIPYWTNEHHAVAVSDALDVVFSDANATATYVWDATGQITRLPSLYELEGVTEWPATAAFGSAISADGRIIVGQSGKWDFTARATQWIDGRPRELPTPGDRPTSASAISADGRVVGGGLFGWNFPTFQPLVWHDGQMRALFDESGAPAVGTVTDVVSGIDGDPNQWAVLGGTSVGHEGSPWIAFSDGVVHPFDKWLNERYGLTMGASQHGLRLAADNEALYVVTFDTETTMPYPGGREPRPLAVSELAAHVYVLPYDFAPLPQAGDVYDVTGDSQVSPADALLVINAINDQITAGINDGSLPTGNNSARLDVSRDGRLTAADALQVINFLNEPATNQSTSTSGNGEGESPADNGSQDLLALAADEFYRELAAPRRSRIGR